jgi:hypothetical protein
MMKLSFSLDKATVRLILLDFRKRYREVKRHYRLDDRRNKVVEFYVNAIRPVSLRDRVKRLRTTHPSWRDVHKLYKAPRTEDDLFDALDKLLEKDLFACVQAYRIRTCAATWTKGALTWRGRCWGAGGRWGGETRMKGCYSVYHECNCNRF